MKVQLIGLGHVGRSLVELVDEKEQFLKSLGINIKIVSVSDSQGTAIDHNGLIPQEILKYKKIEWKGFEKFRKGCDVLEAIRSIESDVIVEVTPSTPSGEPGLSNIKAALAAKKDVVTANKGPLVVAYKDPMSTARENGVKLLYEATVAGHVPVFCLIESCFKADELLGVKGILNATTNFIIGEIEQGKSFQKALDEAVRAGWAETNYSDDVDGMDAARKLVIMANAIFKADAKLEDVKIQGIRHVEPMVKKAKRENRKVKLICEIKRNENKLEMTVSPENVSVDDSLATVNHGDMGIKFAFKTSGEVFVSVQFLSPKQTAYAVLNDIVKTKSERSC